MVVGVSCKRKKGACTPSTDQRQEVKGAGRGGGGGGRRRRQCLERKKATPSKGTLAFMLSLPSVSLLVYLAFMLCSKFRKWKNMVKEEARE